MSEFKNLSPILGVSKKNPVFSVYEHKASKEYHVYYGLELFEVVAADRESPEFKIMVAHLSNAGIARNRLQEVFKVDVRTIRNWSDALKSADAQKMTDAFMGRNKKRKLTDAVKRYVTTRFPYIYKENKKTYSSRIRKEIKEVFDIDICAETLRPLFSELKEQFSGTSKKKGAKSR